MGFGLDFDGTIAQTDLIKSRWIKANFGIDTPRGLTSRTYCQSLLGEYEYRRMVNETSELDATLAIPPSPGAKEVIPRLSELGPIYLVTARTLQQMRNAAVWLENNKLKRYFSGFISSIGEDKQSICAENNLEWLVDDDPRHLHQGAHRINRMAMRLGGDLVNIAGVHNATDWYKALLILRGNYLEAVKFERV